MPEFSIHQLDVPSAGEWSFRDGSLSWNHPKHIVSGRFDPFPAYAHDAGVTANTAEAVADLCPPLYDIEIYLPNREETGRTNGYSANCYPRSYIDGEWVNDPPIGAIVMSGKRIPPHPAMTRYLVGHEYGHHVCWMLGKLRGGKHLQDDSWLSDYAKLRGLPDSLVHHGAGGNWHNSIGEIFSCDFRIMALDIEPEYWPHPGIPHPHQVSALDSWWTLAFNDLRDAPAIT